LEVVCDSDSVVVVTQKIDGGVKIVALGLPLPVEGQTQFEVLHAQLHNAESVAPRLWSAMRMQGNAGKMLE
jgi:hypothetical protein